MKIKTTISLLLVLVCLNSFAQKKALETITENDLKAHMEFVASDYMQGRDFNTDIPGLEITADYLKAQCKKMGLKPGGDDFFQALDLVSVKPDSENTYVELSDKSGDVTFKNNDIFTFGSSENDTIEGDVVFAGYGWFNDETKYNDTEGIDIKDKIVLIMTRNLETALDTSIKKNDTNVEMKKMSKAAMGGAKALILVPDPMNPDKKWFDMVKGFVSGGSLALKGAKSGPSRMMPVKLIFGTEELANAIIKESGKTLAELQNEINETGAPKSFEIKNVSAKIQLGLKTEDAESNNVVGIVEGSHPVLKNECVVFSAHYDHVGMLPNGEINNGADDNASGTVALLEIAEAFMSAKKAPKRSIVFAWVTAEEKGLIGSDYYSQNPVIPLENTLADINLDMVGRSVPAGASVDKEQKQLAGPNGLYIVSGGQSSELNKISDEVCKDLNLVPDGSMSKAFLSRSDYYHFYKNGVPILGLTTGLHSDYHTPADEMEKIDYNKMKRVAQYCYLVANKVANQKKRIVVDNPLEK